MPKAYLIGQLTVNNPEGYKKYSDQVPTIIQKHGGRYVVRGGHSTQLEGQSFGNRQVVIEFPSRQVAETWYHSAEYQAILPHRLANSTGHIAIVDGFDPA